MRVHHLNCGSMHPLGGRLMLAAEDAGPPHMVCHVLLIETGDTLVLVETGLGTEDVRHPDARLGKPFRHIVRPPLRPAETAIEQIRGLGLNPDDVRHILLTHLDLDHAGGVTDFPQARVHVLADEKAAADAHAHWKERERYRPPQFASHKHWSLHQPDGEAWFGFDAVRELEGLPPEILMIPLAGHTRGHAAIAVDTGAGWLLHAGDAYFHRHEMQAKPRCPLGLRLFQQLVAMDNERRAANQDRLRQLAVSQANEVRVFCAHDAAELAQCRASRPA